MNHDQTIPGGAYLVNGVLVNCHGEPLTDAQRAAYAQLRARGQPAAPHDTRDTPDTPDAPDAPDTSDDRPVARVRGVRRAKDAP